MVNFIVAVLWEGDTKWIDGWIKLSNLLKKKKKSFDDNRKMIFKMQANNNITWEIKPSQVLSINWYPFWFIKRNQQANLYIIPQICIIIMQQRNEKQCVRNHCI
eukprot:TRINITY_DN5091_c0_g1_i1.p6 TRINITY_DN5091_c0_g1~~TRINITY_DN5091_c0_g1_i1.p6  ORF type:complete len:104 (+),score=6.38 TRINITY_DN5091_c0_g1_i1:872-1183(+)